MIAQLVHRAFGGGPSLWKRLETEDGGSQGRFSVLSNYGRSGPHSAKVQRSRFRAVDGIYAPVKLM
jgi:hypothetical protein